MSLVVIDQVGPALATIGQEIAEAKLLLLKFESSADQMTEPNSRETVMMERAQGFDLAVQILNEAESILLKLSQAVAKDEKLKPPLPLADIRLERIRGKLLKTQEVPIYDAATQVGQKAELF